MKFKKYKYIGLVCLIASIASLAICFGSIKIDGDFYYHLTRIESLTNGLRHSGFPLRIHDLFFNNYGYPVGIFYPNLMLLIPVFFRYCTFSLLNSYNLSLIVYTFLTAFAVYWSSLKIKLNEKEALIATALYTLSNYRSTCFYLRGAYSEGIALIFIPLAIAAIYNLLQDKKPNWLLLTLSFSGLLLSHIITFVICIIISLIVILINYQKILQPTKILILFKAILLALGLTAYFIIPFLVYYFNYDWHFNYHWANINQFSACFLNTLSIWPLQTSNSLFTCPGFGLVAIFIIALAIFNYRKIRHTFYQQLFFVVIILWLFNLNFTFLDPIHEIFSFMQFPFRVNGIITACLAFLAGKLIYELKYRQLVFAFCFAHSIFSFFYISLLIPPQDINYQSLGYYPDNNYNEFLLNTTDVDYLYANNENYWWNHNDVEISITKNNLTFEIYFTNNNYPDTYLDLPLIYYDGYSAYYQNEDITECLPIKANGYSMMQVSLNNHQQGSIYISFTKTKYMKIADHISLITLSSIILSQGFKLAKKLNTKKSEL